MHHTSLHVSSLMGCREVFRHCKASRSSYFFSHEVCKNNVPKTIAGAKKKLASTFIEPNVCSSRRANESPPAVTSGHKSPGSYKCAYLLATQKKPLTSFSGLFLYLVFWTRPQLQLRPAEVHKIHESQLNITDITSSWHYKLFIKIKTYGHRHHNHAHPEINILIAHDPVILTSLYNLILTL